MGVAVKSNEMRAFAPTTRVSNYINYTPDESQSVYKSFEMNCCGLELICEKIDAVQSHQI
jgi:hypothetical protein